MPSPAAEPESLRKLRLAKSRTLMPETLGGLGGFAAIEAPARGDAEDTDWVNERATREWAHDQKKKAAVIKYDIAA